MLLRPMIARVALLLQQSARARRGLALTPPNGIHTNVLMHWRGATRIPTSRLWMSTSSENDNVDCTVGLERFGNDNPPTAISRPALLGNILPFLEGTAGLVVTGLSLALGLLYFQQDKLLYIPEIQGLNRPNESNPTGYKSPTEYNIPFETHMVETPTRGNFIHSWLLLHPNSKEENLPTIIFFHGNAGNIGIRLPNAAEMYNLGANVFLVEYRGYGDSSRGFEPSEAGIKSDSEAALRFIAQHPNIDASKLFIFGRSLGGAVGFHVAHYAEQNNIPLAGLMVENTFVSIERMVDVLFPFLSPVKGILLRNHYDSSKIVSQLQLPILFLAGDADEIVPHSHMVELFETSRESGASANMHVIKGGMHNDSWLQGGKTYSKAIRDFINTQ